MGEIVVAMHNNEVDYEAHHFTGDSKKTQVTPGNAEEAATGRSRADSADSQLSSLFGAGASDDERPRHGSRRRKKKSIGDSRQAEQPTSHTCTKPAPPCAAHDAWDGEAWDDADVRVAMIGNVDSGATWHLVCAWLLISCQVNRR